MAHHCWLRAWTLGLGTDWQIRTRSCPAHVGLGNFKDRLARKRYIMLGKRRQGEETHLGRLVYPKDAWVRANSVGRTISIAHRSLALWFRLKRWCIERYFKRPFNFSRYPLFLLLALKEPVTTEPTWDKILVKRVWLCVWTEFRNRAQSHPLSCLPLRLFGSPDELQSYHLLGLSFCVGTWSF